MAGYWDYIKKTEEEKVKAHNDYHLRRIGECLTNLRGHYHKIPTRYVKEEEMG